jgi:hypothetical protein
MPAALTSLMVCCLNQPLLAEDPISPKAPQTDGLVAGRARLEWLDLDDKMNVQSKTDCARYLKSWQSFGLPLVMRAMGGLNATQGVSRRSE